jgi:hypothetical protein
MYNWIGTQEIYDKMRESINNEEYYVTGDSILVTIY